MITASLHLSGSLDDGAEVCRDYYLIADFSAHGSGKASIVPLSHGAPIPEGDRLTVKYGGEEGALKAAAEAVKSLPDNRGLKVRAVINPGQARTGRCEINHASGANHVWPDL